jgi:putative tricarboxylic transport membrane protein
MLERVVGLVVVIVAGIYLTLALALPYGTTARPGAGFFPILVGIFACVVGVTMSAVAFRAPVPVPVAVGRERRRDAAARGRALSTVLVLVAFCALLPWIGYPLVAFAFVTVLLRRLGSTWHSAAITGVVAAAVSFYVFGVLLDVPLPRGPW